jgi:hypothetical protein
VESNGTRRIKTVTQGYREAVRRELDSVGVGGRDFE